MVTLRQYQKESVLRTIEAIDQGQNPIIALPTGTGKSLVIAGLVKYYKQYKTKRVLVLTHVKELIQQNKIATERLWPCVCAGVYSAGLQSRDIENDVLFAGIQSLHRVDIEAFDIIIIDECHLVPDNSNTMYRRFIAKQKDLNDQVAVVGLSATPYRLNGGLLIKGDIFDSYSYDKTSMDEFNWFIDQGYLAPLVSFESRVKIDLSGVHVRAGEFKTNEVQAAADKAAITKAAVADMIDRAADRKHWLVFTTGVDHSEHVTQELLRMGVSAACVHHKKTSAERASALARFDSGEIRAIVNSQVLTTGFDSPHIDMIGMLRPMMSPGLWVQSLGRGTRPSEGKADCLVLDYAGNTRRLGPINDVRVANKRGGSGKGSMPVRSCPKCLCLNSIQAKECSHCGYVFPLPKVKITTKPDKAVLVARKKTSTLVVDSVLYGRHIKRTTGAVSLRISYFCGPQVFREWIFPEANKRWLWDKSRRWWSRRANGSVPLPPSTDEALGLVNFLKKPRYVVVEVGGRYPEIKDYIF